jgi:hypothetical protein
MASAPTAGSTRTGEMPPEYYWGLWPLETYLINLLNLGLERVVGHLLGTWLGVETPWIALVTEPVIPKKFRYPRESKFRVKDQGRLVAGALPKRYQIHALNGGGSPTIARASDTKILAAGWVTTYQIMYSHTLVRWEDPGDRMAMEPGGEVVIGCGQIGVSGCPGFPLNLPKWTQKSHLPELCAWLDRYVEERDGV